MDGWDICPNLTGYFLKRDRAIRGGNEGRDGEEKNGEGHAGRDSYKRGEKERNFEFIGVGRVRCVHGSGDSIS